MTNNENVYLEKIVGGGQALGTLDDGRKAFVWGGLPGETVEIQVTKKKSNYVEGVVVNVVTPSPERIEPKDTASYLSTSPWQLMNFDAEQHYKAALVEEAFELHNLVLPNPIDIATDGIQYGYRNKVEFSWYGEENNGAEQLNLAFFRRGSKGKLPVKGTSLAKTEINTLARTIRDLLQQKGVTARELKTLLIRCDQSGNCVWQLYVKDKLRDILSPEEALRLGAQGGEVIYSDPRSPASRITKRLATFGNPVLSDIILDIPFRYATEGFFQVNVPIYEKALEDMQRFVEGREAEKETEVLESKVQASEVTTSFSEDSVFPTERGDTIQQLEPNESEGKDGGSGAGEEVIDLYSGVGSIGLTIGGDNVTLVEINEDAVREMRANIARLKSNATAVLAPSEKALEYITADSVVIVDPPRIGLHANIVERLLETKPPRIIYLSCNPVTQARDVALLAERYGVRFHRGYNFFPRTPHIEHLVVLDRLP